MTKTMDVEVADIRKITGDSKLKAFADVRFGGAMTVKGFGVFQGRDGVFVAMPRKVSKDGKWFDILLADEDLKDAIEEKILESYRLETGGGR